MIIDLTILIGIFLPQWSLGHIDKLMLLVLHQHVVFFIKDALGQNLTLSHVLDDVSEVSFVLEALFALPYYFALVVLGAFEDAEAVAFYVLVKEDVKPGKRQNLALAHIVVHDIGR